jgi:hypothetical protein
MAYSWHYLPKRRNKEDIHKKIFARKQKSDCVMPQDALKMHHWSLDEAGIAFNTLHLAITIAFDTQRLSIKTFYKGFL